MKKNDTSKRALRIFLRTVGVMMIFLAVGVASYSLTMLYYTITERSERSKQYSHVIDVRTGPQSVNLIYSYNEKENKVDKIVLEIFDTDTKNLDYVTIPTGTEIETSPVLFSQMMKTSKEVPQIIRLSKINTYFKGDVAYEYGIKVLNEALNSNIGYFTVIPSEKFNDWFTNRGSSDTPKYAPSDLLLSKVAKCTSESEMNSLIEDTWSDIISDITCVQKEKYSESFLKVKKELIHVYRVYGNKVKDTYTLDRDKTKKLLDKLMDNDAYAKPQSGSEIKNSTSFNSTNTVSSKGLKIQISNASQITGLAAKFKEKLETAGYTILGVGNATGSSSVEVETKILVKKDGVGSDLVSYFASPTVEVSDSIKDGADIEIILGTEDRASGY